MPRPNSDAPGTLADLDVSGYEPMLYAADDEIYERFEVVLGETFQYGPHFRTIRKLRREPETGRLLLDVGVDEAMWADARDEDTCRFRPCLTADSSRSCTTSCSAPIALPFRFAPRT